MTQPAAERIQKRLARAGIGSRRQIEQWIRDGRIKVNGRIAALGDRISPRDRVRLDGRELALDKITSRKTRVLAYYKPVGEICSRRDEKGRKTVFDSLPRLKQGRWINIGRLDLNSIGLLLFTNNGELAHRLMHPSREIEREYAVRVLGEATPEQLQRLRAGVRLDDGEARFTDIVDSGGKGSNHWYHVVIMEGKNREVRRLWESQGLTVSRLMRVRYGPYIMPRRKKPGEFWDLDEKEVHALMQEAGLKSEA
jgi:23S rRNA pseudouridine2605 synthase